MKLNRITAILCLSALLLTACSPSQPDASSQPPADSSSSVPASSQVENIIVTTDPLQVADTALYRGTIQSIGADGSQILLAQEPGRNYGYSSVTFLLTDATRANFDLALMEDGQYLEIYYNPPTCGTEPIEADAIAINYLGKAEHLLFNGTVTSLSVKEGSTVLELESLEDQTPVIFRATQETQFYLDQSAIAVGDKLSIYHSGALTKSFPGQGVALEISPYSEPDSSSSPS